MCRAKFSLVLLSGSGIKAALYLFTVGDGLSCSRVSSWHSAVRGWWLLICRGVSGCNGLMGEQQSCPTFLCFKLQRLNTGGWKI